MERALCSSGLEVVTATTDHGRASSAHNTERLAIGESTVTRFYAPKRTDFYKVAPSLVPWLWRNLNDFDAVHIHALFSFSSVAAGLIARARGVPYIIRPLGTLTAYGMTRRATLKRASFALLEAPILRRAAAVHFTSKQEQEEAHALNIPMRGVVIPLGVEGLGTGDFSRLETEYPVLAGKLVVLFLSRVDPKKNIEALLEGYATNPTARKNSLLVIAGSGEARYTERLKSRAQALGITDYIIWLGHVEGQRKRDAFARADLFVLPSFSENFGIAVLEAMLAGLPCILGEGVAVAKPAAADGAALAVPPAPDGIAAALNRLLSDENLRKTWGRKPARTRSCTIRPKPWPRLLLSFTRTSVARIRRRQRELSRKNYCACPDLRRSCEYRAHTYRSLQLSLGCRSRQRQQRSRIRSAPRASVESTSSITPVCPRSATKSLIELLPTSTMAARMARGSRA